MNQYNVSVKDGIKLFVIYCKFVNLKNSVRMCITLILAFPKIRSI